MGEDRFDTVSSGCCACRPPVADAGIYGCSAFAGFGPAMWHPWRRADARGGGPCRPPRPYRLVPV